MKQTCILMGMPVTVEIVEAGSASSTAREAVNSTFAYFEYVDEKFSTYKQHSEISRINRGELSLAEASPDMQEVFRLSEDMKALTNGYFDIWHAGPDNPAGSYDPSGLVKGWAILNAADMLREQGFESYYVEAGGDIQAAGLNSQGQRWRVGIRNPFNIQELVKVLSITGCGVATSGTYIRSQHIYNPKNDQPITDILSLTVIGPDIYLADCFATAAFSMGRDGIAFIESQPGFEGYMIDKDQIATYTSGFARYVA